MSPDIQVRGYCIQKATLDTDWLDRFATDHGDVVGSSFRSGADRVVAHRLVCVGMRHRCENLFRFMGRVQCDRPHHGREFPMKAHIFEVGLFEERWEASIYVV